MFRAWCNLLLMLVVLGGLGLLSVSAMRHVQQVPGDSSLPVRPVSRSVFSGPTPEGPAQMRQLARLGVRTIVSVDGARPAVDSAADLDLAYVHIPIGYDGIPAAAIGALTRVIEERPLPVYVHCHHGQHRGPAAAAVCAMIAGELTHAQAVDLLEASGTNPDYSGLWQSVESFEPLTSQTLLPELVAEAEVEPMVEAMLRIDHHFAELADVAPDHVTGNVRRAAALLHQEFREAARLLSDNQPPGFAEQMKRAESQTGRIIGCLNDSLRDAPQAISALKQTCTQCHREYRN